MCCETKPGPIKPWASTLLMREVYLLIGSCLSASWSISFYRRVHGSCALRTPVCLSSTSEHLDSLLFFCWHYPNCPRGTWFVFSFQGFFWDPSSRCVTVRRNIFKFWSGVCLASFAKDTLRDIQFVTSVSKMSLPLTYGKG